LTVDRILPNIQESINEQNDCRDGKKNVQAKPLTVSHGDCVMDSGHKRKTVFDKDMVHRQSGKIKE
jgi:hypothetical protein